MTSIGDILTLTPHDLSVDGGAVARHGELVIFLNKGLPGETLSARVTKLKSRFAEAEVLETLAPALPAEPPHCPHAGDCGGCPWPGLPYGVELAWKEKQVMESFRRLGKVAFKEDGNEDGAVYDPIIASPRNLGYRNKLEFAFGHSPEKGVLLGLKRRASHEIVEIEECPLAAAPFGRILEHARARVREAGFSAWNGKEGFLRFLVLRRPDHTPEGNAQCLAELITAPADKAAVEAVRSFGQALLRDCPELTTFLHTERKSPSPVAYGEKIRTCLGPDRLWEQTGPLLLEAPAAAFLQVNTAAAALLYATVKEYSALTGSESVWDLYSGVGGIALTLAGQALSLRGFESAPEAVAFAKRNAQQQGAANASFIAGDVTALLRKERAAPDLVITDPPRAGLDEAVTRELLRLAPRRIILVGCAPATMARDIARLAARYAVKRVRAVDLFPRTPHVESVALLTLRD